jgi:hypothetical protein
MPDFEWDAAKEGQSGQTWRRIRVRPACVSGPLSLIAEDLQHSGGERRYLCFGRIEAGVMTVRFTWRNGRIRIFGAGYWRKGKGNL